MQKPLLLLVLSTFTVLISSAQTTHQVAVTNNVFTPANLTIEVGDIVEWTCTQGTHNVNGTTATFPSNPESFGNSVAPATWTYSHTFTTVGDYDYQCDPHQFIGMVGTITVNPCSLPEIEFTSSANNLTVDFTNTTVGNLTGTLWDFGDGNISFNNETPQHSYAAEGTYTVCLTGTNNCGSDSTCQTVAVSCPDAESVFSYSAAGLSVGFTDASLNTPNSWLWDYGDGNISTQQNPNHTYAASGTYTVCLTVTNDCGTDSSCQTLQVSCLVPEIEFTASANNLTVDFTNTTVGNLTGTLWDFGDGNISFNNETPQHSYAAEGTYTVCLTGTNNCGSDSTCQTVAVSCPDAESVFSYSAAGLSVGFTDASLNTPTSWLWDYGDGNISTQQNPNHTYAASGTYTVCLTVTNDCGTDSSCQSVTTTLPDNDDCANATLLTVGSSCSLQTFDSQFHTAENPQPAPNPGCGFFQGSDVWFRAVVPVSGALRIERDNGTLNAQFAIYSGTCGSMEVISCAQLDAARTIHRPDLAGQEVYIRVWGYNTANGGTFDICVWEPEIPVNNYCADAVELTVGQTCELDTFTCVYATADTTTNQPNPGCGFYQGGDVWFKFDMPSSGELRIDRANISGNAQYAVYDGTCGNFTVLDCAQLDDGTTLVLPDQAGETLYLRVWGYNSEEGAEFAICLWDPPVPVNDLCANAIPLSVGDTCSFSAFSSRYATTDTAGTAPGPGCGFYQGGDVWFTVEMPVTGMLHLERENLNGNAQFALYEGTCGNFTSVIDCAQLTSEMEIDEPTLAGETLYLRVFGYNSEEGAEFEFCAYDTTCNSFEIEIVLQGNTLMSTSAHFSYLWIGCPGTPDPGLLTATFTPTVSGEYRLIADDPTGYGCLDTSNCVYVLVTDIEQSMESSVEIYPNPSNGSVRIDLSGTDGNGLLEVLAIDGSLIRSFVTAKTPERIELNLETGIYIVKWASEKGEIRTKRLVILNQ